MRELQEEEVEIMVWDDYRNCEQKGTLGINQLGSINKKITQNTLADVIRFRSDLHLSLSCFVVSQWFEIRFEWKLEIVVILFLW